MEQTEVRLQPNARFAAFSASAEMTARGLHFKLTPHSLRAWLALSLLLFTANSPDLPTRGAEGPE